MKEQLTTEEVQRHFPFFAEPELQRQIADQGRIHRFAEGEVIMHYGSYIRMLPLVIEGTIKVSRLAEDGSELFLYYLNPGESCTMTFSCCLSDKQSSILAVAEEETVLLGLPRRSLDEWMSRFVSWKNFVMQSYDARMNELLKTIDQVTFHQLDERLLAYLHERAIATNNGNINTTHQRIADDLHVSREAVSRLLKGFEKRGVVELGRNLVSIRQPAIQADLHTSAG